jgi:membrane complex biogenesis BtpA family protein
MPFALPDLFAAPKPIIGMLHMPPLAGSPRYGGSFAAVRDFVLRDLDALASGGVHGLLLENFGDAPFYPDRVPALVVAQMTALASEVRRRTDLPLGINVLRNDGRSALAVAFASGAQFIRVNILCGARVTDQGIIQGIAHDLLRDRVQLGATEIRIFADVNVKHSAPLAARPLADEVQDTLERGGADALIVSGSATGKATDLTELDAVRVAVVSAPILIGSGLTPESLASYLPHADGFIIGTGFKHGGLVTSPIDPARVRAAVDVGGR